MSLPAEWNCPECGAVVGLSAEVLPLRPGSDPDALDRLAHALCGCYVLSMPSGALARLLASLLAAEGDGGDEL